MVLSFLGPGVSAGEQSGGVRVAGWGRGTGTVTASWWQVQLAQAACFRSDPLVSGVLWGMGSGSSK